jgi:cbb3-type cytochrome oxidase maturation protein
MKVILFLILASLLVALGFLIAFFWAVGTGQYDDDVTPSMRILFDDHQVLTDDRNGDTENE